MAPTDIALDLANPQDAADIADLFLASRADALPYLPKLHSDDETRGWIANTVMRRCRVWVARREGRILGFLALDGEDLDQLYLRPGCYRQGIGARLLAIAKRESPARLHLYAFQRNIRACAFYEAHGFRVVNRNDGSRNEEGEPDVLYEWTPGPD
jgi:ribosomal protein S18 acetylase RimI-like enzyme